MPGRSSRRKGRQSRKLSDGYLLALLALAALTVGVVLWLLVGRPGTGPRGAADFADRLRALAAAAGAGPKDVKADDPIRKIDGVFVRSWRIGLDDADAVDSLRDAVIAEARRRGGEIGQGPTRIGLSTYLRVDMGPEAFDLELRAVGEERPPTPAPTATRPPPPTATPRPEPPAGARGRLAVLLDDAGQSTDLLAAAAALPSAVGVAVLPFLPHTSDVAAEMHRSGHEIWLHLPMEPEDYPKSNPGPGAIMVSMSEDDIRLTVRAALNNVPHVVGVNNHMGSKASADLRATTWVMQELKARGLAFIDSRTTTRTVAEDAARAQGVPANRRKVFLDNQRSAGAIRRQLDEAVYRCRMEGEVIAIGHLAPVTVRVLAKELPKLAGRGADLVPPTELVH